MKSPRTRRWRPSPSSAAVAMSATALLIAATGITPAEAAKAVKRALTADNATRVGGIQASKKPEPNKLVPLGPDAKLPAAVVPAGLRGPRGAQGPAGDTGPRGPANVIVRRRSGGASVGLEAKASVDVATMKVPAGNWLLRYDTQAYYLPAGVNENDWFTCGLVIGGVPAPEGRDALVGNNPAASGTAQITDQTTLRLSAETKVVLRCWHPSTLTSRGQPPGFRFTTLTAIETASVDTDDVTG